MSGASRAATSTARSNDSGSWRSTTTAGPAGAGAGLVEAGLPTPDSVPVTAMGAGPVAAVGSVPLGAGSVETGSGTAGGVGSVAVPAGSMSGAGPGAAVGSVPLGAGPVETGSGTAGGVGTVAVPAGSMSGSGAPGGVASLLVGAGDAASVGAVGCRSAPVVVGAGAGPVAGAPDRTGAPSTPGADRASPKSTTEVVGGTTMASSDGAAVRGAEHPSGTARHKAATAATTSDSASFMIGLRRHPGPLGPALSAPADHTATTTTTRRNSSTSPTTTVSLPGRCAGSGVCPASRVLFSVRRGRLEGSVVG